MKLIELLSILQPDELKHIESALKSENDSMLLLFKEIRKHDEASFKKEKAKLKFVLIH